MKVKLKRKRNVPEFFLVHSFLFEESKKYYNQSLYKVYIPFL